MKRIMFLRNIGIGAMVTALLVWGAPAQNTSETKLKIDRLTDNLHVIYGAGGNIGVYCSPDHLVVVDCGVEALSGKVAQAISGISARPVAFLINTHWHYDHAGGNAHFKKAGCRIIAHTHVRQLMSGDRKLRVIDVNVPASPPESWPDITYEKSIHLHETDEDIQLRYIPGAHSAGDTVVTFKRANVIHCGDVFFHIGGYPYIDTANGGSIDGMISAVNTILDMCNDSTRLIPGHGPVCGPSDLREFGTMLAQFREVIAREIKAGKDLKTILTEKPTAALDKVWGHGGFTSEMFTRMVVDSLLSEQ